MAQSSHSGHEHHQHGGQTYLMFWINMVLGLSPRPSAARSSRWRRSKRVSNRESNETLSLGIKIRNDNAFDLWGGVFLY